MYGEGCNSYWGLSEKEALLGKEDQALKGALEGKEGLTEGWARGEGL